MISSFLLTGTAAAQGIQAYLGDTIPLSGYSPTGPYVYLFLTGPNLPADGVALDNINRLAEDGEFTKVPVEGENDMWSYKWGTNSLGGRLDAGTYTIWVVDNPDDLSHLANDNYATISVTLSSPAISIDNTVTPVQPPSLEVSSEPDYASVSVDNQYLGKTPFSTDNLSAGTYTIKISKFGYVPFTTNASLVNDMTTVINATLPVENGALAITTNPSGANISIDGKDAGIAPVTITDLAPGNYTVSVTKDGFNPSEQKVTISPESTFRLAVVLEPVSPVAAALPLKTPGPIAGILLGLCAGVAAIAYCRQGSG
jgi:PEGA domain